MPHHPNMAKQALRMTALACSLAGWLPALAATDAPAAKPAAKAAVKTPPKPSTPRQKLKSEAGGLALATSTVEIISQAQLDVAARVLTGTADCEFNQRITVQPVADLPGVFSVAYKALRYTMVPEETTTGAVRLQDKRAGVVWLQIPTKSMLMNAKLGQRMVDACLHAEQRIAVAAAARAGAGAGPGIGITPVAAPAPAPAPAPEPSAASAPAAPAASAAN